MGRLCLWERQFCPAQFCFGDTAVLGAPAAILLHLRPVSSLGVVGSLALRAPGLSGDICLEQGCLSWMAKRCFFLAGPPLALSLSQLIGSLLSSDLPASSTSRCGTNRNRLMGLGRQLLPQISGGLSRRPLSLDEETLHDSSP